MSRFARLILLVGALGLLGPGAAWAQYLSELVGFNSNGGQLPIDNPATSQEMFRSPQYSPTTAGFILANSGEGIYDFNAAYRAAGLQTEGDAAMYVFFYWKEPIINSDAWVRLTTSNGTLRPNPSLHTEGKVRFKITNQSGLFYGPVGICLGIRETDVLAPQMGDGGTVGDIEWVGVNSIPNGIIAGPNWIVETTAQGDDEQLYPVGTDINALGLNSGTAVIGPGPNGEMNTAPGGDDQIRFGYRIGANGDRVPIPAVVLNPGVVPVSLEWNLQTGVVKVDGVPQPNCGVAGFTGDGDLTTPNHRGTLEHIVITNANTPENNWQQIILGLDELQFEAPEPDPVFPPTVVSPIIQGDTQITVTDLQYGVDVVKLFKNHSLFLSKNVSSNADAVFDFPPGQSAQVGEVYTATQIVDGLESSESAEVEVLPEAPPYSFSLVIDENGDGSCSYDPPGGWEFVPVTGVDTLPNGDKLPHGMDLIADSSIWQTYDVTLTDDNLVTAWLGGNGNLDNSPTGKYTIDSLWFTISGSGNIGPHEVLIDAVELLDASDNVMQVIHDFENGVNYLQNPRSQSTTGPTTSALTTAGSYDGDTCHHLAWTYPTSANESLGMYHNIGYACGTSPQFSDQGAKIRFHMVIRRQPINTLPLPEVMGPVVGNQSSVRVFSDSTATLLQLYLNGDPVGDPVPPTGTQTDFTGLTLLPGDSISAKQVISDVESDFAYPRALAPQPAPPTVQAPLVPGMQQVTVLDVYYVDFAQASDVAVNVNNGQQIVHVTPTGASVLVTLNTPLANGDVVFATQTVNETTSRPSASVTVGFPAPVIYAAPGPGNVNVRVQELHPAADHVTVRVNATTDFTAVIPPGATYVAVPVTGLVTGDTLVAFQSFGTANSENSAPDTVTTNQTATIVCDHFEYDEATFQATWVDSPPAGDLSLSTDQNATQGGAKSVYNPGTNGRVQKPIANLIPSATTPVVWNVNIYDTYGPGASGGNQFAQLNGQVADFYYQHVGICGPNVQPYLNTNYYQFRANSNGGPDWINLTQYDSPTRSVGWHTFTVVHKGYKIDVYVDQMLAAKNVSLSAQTTFDMCRIGPGVSNNIPGYYDDYCVVTGPVQFITRPPNAGSIQAPIEDGNEALTVTGVDTDVTLLEIVDAGNQVIGSFSGTVPSNGVVDVTLTRALNHLEKIRSHATSPRGTSYSPPLEVGWGNGDILVCIGVRETNDSGPLGTPGGNTGTIEWIGASGTLNGAPQGKLLSLSSNWVSLTFDPASDPITGFTGNGTLDVPRGTLEHLAVAVNAASADRSTGMYELFVDNVVNVGAGSGGTDFVITDFDSYTPGMQVLFQYPTYSGSTTMHLTRTPSSSSVSDQEGHPGQSELLVWFWLDTTDQRWARITSYAAANKPSPIIDLTKPIRIDFLLRPVVTIVRGDADCSGAVNAFDIDPFVLGLTNFAGWQAAYPGCPWQNLDCDCSGAINAFDIDPFVLCLTTGCPPCP